MLEFARIDLPEAHRSFLVSRGAALTVRRKGEIDDLPTGAAERVEPQSTVAAAGRLPPLTRKKVVQLVVGQGQQPTPKRATLAIIVEPAHRGTNRPQNVLSQVGSVGVLQSVAAAVAIHQRRVKAHE